MRALVVHNPKAGKKTLSADELMAELRSVGISPSYCSSNDQAFPDCLREPVDLMIAAGGDGTVAKLIRNMPSRSVPIGILPLGTANNIARSLKITGAPRELAAGWSLDWTRRLDIGVARGKWGHCQFVEAVGVGSLTRSIQDVDRTSAKSTDPLRHGRLTLAKILAAARPAKVRLTLDGHDQSGDFLLVEILNTKSVGPRLKLAPPADPGDGQLNVVCLKADQREEMIEWLRAPDHKSAPLTAARSKHVAVAWRATALRVDDKVLTEPKDKCSATVRVEAHVNILVSPA
jgi:diacylglycerol kinase family enzyme